MSSSTRNTLGGQHSDRKRVRTARAHQLKPSRGFSGSATIPPAMVAARCGETAAGHHGAAARMVVLRGGAPGELAEAASARSLVDAGRWTWTLDGPLG